jgi:hypothetical protein
MTILNGLPPQAGFATLGMPPGASMGASYGQPIKIAKEFFFYIVTDLVSREKATRCMSEGSDSFENTRNLFLFE